MGSPEFPTLPWSRATVFDPGGPAEAVAVGFLGIAFRFTNSVGIHSLFSSRGSIPSRCRIAAHDLLVYASPTLLPALTQHSVPGALPGLPELGLSPSRQSRASLGAVAMELNSAEQSPTPLVFRTVHEIQHLTRLLNRLVLVTQTSVQLVMAMSV